MANQKSWLKNIGEFPMFDHETNTRFEPGQAIRAEVTAFVSQQPTIIRVVDPNSDNPEKEQPKVDLANEADAKALAEREKAAEAVMAGAAAELAAAPAGDAA